MCSVKFDNGNGLTAESDSYVPEGIGIGDAYGDYVEMSIDMETGQILNWKQISDAKIIKAIKNV